MELQTLIYESGDRVARITLNRPERGNGITLRMPVEVAECVERANLDPEKLNIHGGAIALGHPFGMTGARIMTTLLNNLDATDGRYGLESMCVAGGMGQAMIVERIN